MNAPKASTERKVVVLGTGGTIAGTAESATDSVGYRAASLGVQALLDAVPALAGWPIECEQVAQVDSKDMTLALWLTLAAALHRHLQRPEVYGVVITHGTDSLEETAYFLHRVLAPSKPVVLTAAMRPATSLQADGPQNLLDAVTLAHGGTLGGVLAVLGGRVFSAVDLRKQHGWRVDAFGGVGRLEAQFGSDLCARRRGAGAFDGALHQVEDLLLAGGELRAFFHRVPIEALEFCPVTVFSSRK
jgi:L-asparaginase